LTIFKHGLEAESRCKKPGIEKSLGFLRVESFLQDRLHPRPLVVFAEKTFPGFLVLYPSAASLLWECIQPGDRVWMETAGYPIHPNRIGDPRGRQGSASVIQDSAASCGLINTVCTYSTWSASGGDNQKRPDLP
jgi:hypothetical protein